jgi:hypothetical protein
MAANALAARFSNLTVRSAADAEDLFSRMFGPGIALDLSDPANPMLLHLQHIGDIDI